MRKHQFLIYLFVLIMLFSVIGCKGNFEEPVGSPTMEAEVSMTPAPTPTPVPTPTPLPFEANIVDIPDEGTVNEMALDTLEEEPFFVEITNTDEVVLVEFWRADSAYCAEVSERLVELSQEMGIKIVRVNVDENPKLADRYGLVALPAVYVFLGGEQVDAQLGAAPYDVYKALVEKYQ